MSPSSLIFPLTVFSKSAASLNPADFKFLVKSSSIETVKSKLILRSNNALIDKELSYWDIPFDTAYLPLKTSSY